MSEHVFDVIQVGYGPVSQSLALMLGRQDRSVAVVERWESRYPLPRAVCIDHELYRVLSANGLGSVLPTVSEPGPLYQWFNAEWKELLTIDWSAPSISGGPETHFVHQPTVEAALDDAVRALPSVELNLGWEVIAVRQDAKLAHVDMKHGETGEIRSLSAKFVVGCDGANSIVRRTIGGEQTDKGFEADWLVIDVKLKPGKTIEALGIPAAAQFCNPARPTTIVPAGVQGDGIFRRWEFMRLPGETNEELEAEDNVWEMLKPWAGPDDVELVRHKIYNFRSLSAETWRDGRLLIAGDAAHVMPPFMGQGMCSGMRDAWNLTWKLGLILDGKSDASLLDSYEPERAPHVAQVTEMSIYLGKMICMPDAKDAAARDESFFNGTAPPPPPFPCLTDGIIRSGADGKPASGAGLLSPHVEVGTDTDRIRLDELITGRFVVLTRGGGPRAYLDDATASALDQLDTVHLQLASGPGERGIVDLDGRMSAFLDDMNWSAMIIRPDFYIYGGVSGLSALQGLADELLADLRDAGVHTAKPSLFSPENMDLAL